MELKEPAPPPHSVVRLCDPNAKLTLIIFNVVNIVIFKKIWLLIIYVFIVTTHHLFIIVVLSSFV